MIGGRPTHGQEWAESKGDGEGWGGFVFGRTRVEVDHTWTEFGQICGLTSTQSCLSPQKAGATRDRCSVLRNERSRVSIVSPPRVAQIWRNRA